MKDKKKIVIGALCALIMIMAVGYALLSQQLSITGSASITSNWQVEITDIKEVENIGSGRTISTDYTATTATFNTGVVHTGDKITYEITVTNKGTLDAVLEGYTIDTGDNDAIVVNTSYGKDYYRGIKLSKNGGTNKIKIIVQYNPDVTTQPTNSNSSVTVSLNYQQDLGQISPEYTAYAIGDTINFAGTEWKVINTSTKNDDYVTVMKSTILTRTELGSYAMSKSDGTEVGHLHYYWSDTCHGSYTYKDGETYTSWYYAGCEGHNDFDGSKIKEFLDEVYLPRLGEDNLKTIELDESSYKIRLITKQELEDNFGIVNKKVTENTPAWISADFKGSNTSVYTYWTMTPDENSTSNIYYISPNGDLVGDSPNNGMWASGVRPVINLLKSAIDN